MEHPLTINLLPWREKRAQQTKILRTSGAIAVIVLTLFALFFIYQEEKAPEIAHAQIENLGESVINPKAAWNFSTLLLHTLSKKTPNEIALTQVSYEDKQASLSGQSNDILALNQFIHLLQSQLHTGDVKLTSLAENQTLTFSIRIIPAFKKTKKMQNKSTFDFSRWANTLIQNTKKYSLASLSIKPVDNQIQIETKGDYRALVGVFSWIYESKTPASITKWTIQKSQHALLLTATIEVLS